MALLVLCAAGCSPRTQAPTEAWRPAESVAREAEAGWTGWVSGTLRGASGAGEVLRGVRVEIRQFDSILADTVTDRSGAFALRAAGLVPGAFLRIGLPGGGAFYATLALAGDRVDLGTVTVGEVRRLEGIAVLPGGEPIRGAALRMSVAGGGSGLRVTTRSGPEGRFRFDLGLEGAAILTCAAGGISGRPILIPDAAWETAAQPWVACFPARGTIFVEVKDAAGEPLEDVRVRLEPEAAEAVKIPDPVYFPMGELRAPRVEQTNIWGVAIFHLIDDVPWAAKVLDGPDVLGGAAGLRTGETVQRIIVHRGGTVQR